MVWKHTGVGHGCPLTSLVMMLAVSPFSEVETPFVPESTLVSGQQSSAGI